LNFKFCISLFVFLFLLLALSPSVFSQEIEQKLEGITYSSGPFQDPLGRFSMTVPAGWQGYSEKEGGDVCFLTCNQGIFATFSISMVEAKNNTSSASLRDKTLKKFEGVETFQVIAEAELTISGVPSIWLHMSQSFDTGEKILADEYYFVKDNYAYTIHFDTSETGYELLSPDFKSILDSFKLK